MVSGHSVVEINSVWNSERISDFYEKVKKNHPLNPDNFSGTFPWGNVLIYGKSINKKASILRKRLCLILVNKMKKRH